MAPRDIAHPLESAVPAARPDLDARLGGAEPDRLALACSAYLALPGLVFLAGWARPAAAVAAGGAAALALLLSPGWRRRAGPSRALLCLCLALGLAWAGLGGAQHWLYSTADWQVRDAVLADLSRGSWPVLYGPEGEPGAEVLRAPLGYFLVAGWIGRALESAEVARLALWAWTGLGFALALALLAALARDLGHGGARGFATLAGVFVVFGGMDVVPNLILDGLAQGNALAAWGRGGEWWARWFQFPGHVPSVLWAPNHTMPAWLAALLLLRHGRTAGFARSVALPLGAGAFWGPVSAAGAAVLAVASVLRHGTLGAALRSPANWLAAIFALPLALFLTAGAGEVTHGLLFELRPWREALWRWPLFLLVEVGVWAALVALVLRSWLVGVSVALLALLPLYVFGDGNEMTARGSQAALALLAVAAGAALLLAKRAWHRGLLLAALFVAALGQGMEASLLTRPAWPASECSVPEAARQSVFRSVTDWSHYLAPWPDPRLAPWMRDTEARLVPLVGKGEPCWPRGGV